MSRRRQDARRPRQRFIAGRAERAYRLLGLSGLEGHVGQSGPFGAAARMIAQTDQKPSVMSLPVLLTVTASNLSVTVKAKDGDHSGGEVWLCPLAKAVSVAIGRGENHGRTITYHNVVRRWVKLGDWTGTDA